MIFEKYAYKSSTFLGQFILIHALFSILSLIVLPLSFHVLTVELVMVWVPLFSHNAILDPQSWEDQISHFKGLSNLTTMYWRLWKI